MDAFNAHLFLCRKLLSKLNQINYLYTFHIVPRFPPKIVKIIQESKSITKELTNENYLMEKCMWDVANYLKDNDKPLNINYFGQV